MLRAWATRDMAAGKMEPREGADARRWKYEPPAEISASHNEERKELKRGTKRKHHAQVMLGDVV